MQWAIQHGRFTAILTNPPGANLPGKPPDLIPPFGTALGALSGFNFFAFAADKFLAALNALASTTRSTCCPTRPS